MIRGVPSRFYDHLRAVSERAAWHEWIEYFLLGVARMSEDALSRATRLFPNGLRGWPVSLTPCESLSCYQPTRLSGAARRLNIAFTTAQRAIQRLEQKRVVRKTTDARRNRVYGAQALLDILEEPAQLKPISSV